MEVKKLWMFFFALFLVPIVANATQEQVRVDLNEYVDQEVVYNPLQSTSGTWVDEDESQIVYNSSGEIVISNQNPNGKTISDIYVSFNYTTNMTSPQRIEGRNGSIIDENLSENVLMIHIPELESGENSTWSYNVNDSNVKPVLNMTSNYSSTKALAGSQLGITDTLSNEFSNATYQSGTCIYDINVTQNTLPINFSGSEQDFLYAGNTGGEDGSNTTITNGSSTLNWDVLGGNCLNKGESTNILYNVSVPSNVPVTDDYQFINSTLEYRMNQTMSQLNVVDITAVSEGSLDFDKQSLGPADSNDYGSNVTWNVTGNFLTSTNITYNLTSATLWVASRSPNVDPNNVDNDPISGDTLQVNHSPNVLVNSSSPWSSPQWLFNYSDLPSPVVFQDTDFTIYDDGTQLMNRSVTRNDKDIYIKEVYLIVGYWLQIDKNITSIGNDSYNVKVDVHNKGSQVTPADSVVTVYDFIPEEFNVTSNFNYQSSPWYNTTKSENNVSGSFNGTVVQWGLLPTNSLNTSLDAGPNKTINSTWSADFNVTGEGDYSVIDAFVTGLDPQQVDGAGSTQSTVVNEVIERVGSTEGWFALSAGVLLLFGLLF